MAKNTDFAKNDYSVVGIAPAITLGLPPAAAAAAEAAAAAAPSAC